MTEQTARPQRNQNRKSKIKRAGRAEKGTGKQTEAREKKRGGGRGREFGKAVERC